MSGKLLNYFFFTIVHMIKATPVRCGFGYRRIYLPWGMGRFILQKVALVQIEKETGGTCYGKDVYDHKQRIYRMYNYALTLGEVVHHKGCKQS